MHQNTAIATAAAALANSILGANRTFIIPLTLPFSPHICVRAIDARPLGWIPPRLLTHNGGLQSLSIFSTQKRLGKDREILTSAGAPERNSVAGSKDTHGGPLCQGKVRGTTCEV
jgi:hypothetical protein